MRLKTVCDNCKSVLLIKEHTKAPVVSCPRCLKRVAVPRKPPVQKSADGLPEPSGLISVCPECDREIHWTWHFCAHCNQPLVGGRRRRSPTQTVPRSTSDTDIRGDTGLIGIGLIGLGLLLFFGLILFILRGGAGVPSPQAVLVVGGAPLCIIIIGMVLGITGKQRDSSIGAGIFGGLAIALVALLLPFAVFLAMFVSCVEDCKGHGRSSSMEPRQGVEQERTTW